MGGDVTGGVQSSCCCIVIRWRGTDCSSHCFYTGGPFRKQLLIFWESDGPGVAPSSTSEPLGAAIFFPGKSPKKRRRCNQEEQPRSYVPAFKFQLSAGEERRGAERSAPLSGWHPPEQNVTARHFFVSNAGAKKMLKRKIERDEERRVECAECVTVWFQ